MGKNLPPRVFIKGRWYYIRVADIEAPDVAAFLSPFKSKPRTFNAYRALVRELMRFAIEKGFRSDNPVEYLKTMTVRARTRYITDSELRRIKVGAIYGDDGTQTRSGLMLCALVHMAYLTGQAIGDLLDLRWARDPDEPLAPHVQQNGIWFARKKLRKSTRDEVLIEWSPRLRDDPPTEGAEAEAPGNPLIPPS